MRVLITGASGFAGKHLLHKLNRDSDAELFGGYFFDKPADDLPVKHFSLDLTDNDDVRKHVARIAPDEVYHLAGISFPPDAEKDRMAAFAVNIGGGLNLLEALAESAPKAKIVIVSSSEVYGKILPEELPLVESRPPAPGNIYAATKLCLETMSNQYCQNPGLDIRIARPFNHIGPGQGIKFVASDFATQIAKIEAGQASPVITTGNLDVARDFTDVRDVVAGYTDIMRHGKKGEIYHVCSEKTVTIKTVLDILLKLSTVADIVHEYDPTRMRPSENSVICGSAAKLENLAGWVPSRSLESTLADILDDRRQIVQEQIAS